MMDIHTQSHLDGAERINLGSFYTPKKYVSLVGEWLVRYGLSSGRAVLDSSCGYGAFFELRESLPGNRYLGNDTDEVALRTVQRFFPEVETFCENALFDVSRKKFGVRNGESLVVVGNPPYNDVTSQINRGVKRSELPVDADLKSRDLGISFLKSYDKLEADYAAILHPLSYLIKKANFKAVGAFFENYSLLEHIVFDSREFAGTSKTSGFPVVVALYGRTPGRGIRFDDVWNGRGKRVFAFRLGLRFRFRGKISREKALLSGDSFLHVAGHQRVEALPDFYRGPHRERRRRGPRKISLLLLHRLL